MPDWYPHPAIGTTKTLGSITWEWNGTAWVNKSYNIGGLKYQEDLYINTNHELIVVFSDSTEKNLGSILGPTGASGRGISDIEVNTQNQLVIKYTDNTQDAFDLSSLIGGGGNVATDLLWNARGDLAVGTGPDTAQRLPIGSNDQALIADSSISTFGLKWANIVNSVSGTPNEVTVSGSTGSVTIGLPDNIVIVDLDTEQIDFDTTPTSSTMAQARMLWDATYSTLNLGLNANVVCRVGQDLYKIVHNNSGGALSKGDVVYISGAHASTSLTVAKARADSESTSSTTIGVAAQSISNGDDGFIQVFGLLSGITTNAITGSPNDGDALYLDETTAGAVRKGLPAAPNHGVRIGFLVKSAGGGAGSIFVNIQNYQELEELSDVTITSAATNDFLVYDTNKWVDKAPADARAALGLGTLATQSNTFTGSSTGTNTGDQNVFSTVSVSGGGSAVADNISDTLTLVAGSGMQITANTNDQIVFSSTGVPAGSDRHIQFNDNGVFGSSSNLTYSTGDVLQLGGDLQVNGGDIITAASTFNLLNTNATTVNAFGVATNIIMGATTGSATTTIRGGTLVGNATTQNVFDTNAYTVNAFGQAGTLNIANNASTLTSTNYNLMTGASGFGTTKTINFGTNGASGSTSNINIGTGSSGTVNLNLGSVLGTTTVNGQLAVFNGSIRLEEDNSNGSNYVEIQAPSALTSNYTLTLPENDGDANQVLQTDGSGNLSWVNQTGGSGTPSGLTTYVQFNDSGSFGGDAGLRYDKNADALTITGSLRLEEDSSNGTNYLALQANENMASNVTLTFPATAGSSNQVLSTDGSGNLSWITASGSPAGTVGQIQYNSGSGTFAASAALEFSAASQYLYLGETSGTTVPELQLRNRGIVKFIEANTSGGTGFVNLRAPLGDITNNYELVLPLNAPSAGTYLKASSITSQAHPFPDLVTLTWDNPPGVAIGGIGNIQYSAGSGVFTSDNNFTITITQEAPFEATLKVGDTVRTEDYVGIISLYNQGYIKLREAGSGTNYAAFRAAASMSEDTIYTLPAATGTPNQVLAIDSVNTNDETVLKWYTVPSGSGTPGGSNTYVQFNDDGSFAGDAGLRYDKNNDALTITGSLRLEEDSSNGTQYVSLQAASNMSANNVYTLPPSKPTSTNQVLAIDVITGNDATLKWYTVPSGGTPGGNETEIQYHGVDGAFAGDSRFTWSQENVELQISSANLYLNNSSVLITGNNSISFQETGGGLDTVSLKAPSSVSASVTLILPNNAGSSGQVLTTDGTGTLSWSTAAGSVPDFILYRLGIV